MKTSEQISSVAKALTKFQGIVQNIPKDTENPYFKTKYADLASIWNSIREPLTQCDLSVFQAPESNGKQVKIISRLMHISGEYLESELTMDAADSSPQKIGSAITYGRRYSLSSMLGLATDEDDDGNAAQPQKQPAKQNAPIQQPAQPAKDPAWTKAYNDAFIVIDNYKKQELINDTDIKLTIQTIALKTGEKKTKWSELTIDQINQVVDKIVEICDFKKSEKAMNQGAKNE